MAASEQSKIAACNVIQFLTIKFLSVFFYNLTLQYRVSKNSHVRTYAFYKISVILRDSQVKSKRPIVQSPNV